MNELELSKTNTPTVDINALLTKAVDSKAAVEILKELRCMWREDEARRSEQLFNEAMQKVQNEVPPIVKTGRNPSTNSAFARMENLQGVVTPIALAHGFTMSFGTDKSELPEHYGVTCDLAHENGHKQHYRCDVPCDMYGPKGLANKTRTHGFGSAISYGQRYLLKLMFNLRLIGEDDDGNLGVRPKQPSPRVDPVKKHKAKLWEMTQAIHSGDVNKLNQWLWRNDILDGAVPERVEGLSETKLAEVIEKVKGLM